MKPSSEAQNSQPGWVAEVLNFWFVETLRQHWFAGGAAFDEEERVFLYLPFEHQENADAQARSLELISALGDPELTKYARAHKDVIDRLGRFPHRNAILGRTSTAEEIEFLEEPDSSF